MDKSEKAYNDLEKSIQDKIEKGKAGWAIGTALTGDPLLGGAMGYGLGEVAGQLGIPQALKRRFSGKLTPTRTPKPVSSQPVQTNTTATPQSRPIKRVVKKPVPPMPTSGGPIPSTSQSSTPSADTEKIRWANVQSKAPKSTVGTPPPMPENPKEEVAKPTTPPIEAKPKTKVKKPVVAAKPRRKVRAAPSVIDALGNEVGKIINDAIEGKKRTGRSGKLAVRRKSMAGTPSAVAPKQAASGVVPPTPRKKSPAPVKNIPQPAAQTTPAGGTDINSFLDNKVEEFVKTGMSKEAAIQKVYDDMLGGKETKMEKGGDRDPDTDIASGYERSSIKEGHVSPEIMRQVEAKEKMQKGGPGSGRMPGVNSVKPVRMIKPFQSMPRLPNNSGALMQGSLNKSEVSPMGEKKPIELKKALNSVGKAISMLIDLQKAEAPFVPEKGMEKDIQGLDPSTEDPNLGKWLPNAISSGGIDSLLNHPTAGAAIKGGAAEIGEKIIEKLGGDIRLNPEEVGMAVLRSISELTGEDEKLGKSWNDVSSGLITRKPIRKFAPIAPAIAATGRAVLPVVARGAAQAGGAALGDYAANKISNKLQHKAVAEPLSSKKGAMEERKPVEKEAEGEANIQAHPMNANTRDLGEKNQKTVTG